MNTTYLTYSGMSCNVMLLIVSIILWMMSALWYPNLDGVSVYDMLPIIPDKSLFMNLPSKINPDEAFSAEALMLNYCVFPKVYNELILRNTNDNLVISSYLKSRGLSQARADDTQKVWNRIANDLKAMERSNAEYNLPYDDLIVPNGAIEISSQYFPPVCRCINKALSVFENKGNTDIEFHNAETSISNCLATRHIIKQQTLMGNSDYKNSDLKNRKYISRYALLFQLCLSFGIGFFYNMIDFRLPMNNICSRNGMCYGGLSVVFILLWVGHVFSALSSLNSNNAISFISLLTLTALGLGLPVEFMWSYVANTVDVGRQTYMHPLSFYFTLSALYMIALIENGVFTMSVIVTYIMQCNAMSMAYAGAIFVCHGKLWKMSTSSRTGLMLLIFLPATMHIFHTVPMYPVNCERNLLWIMPVIFAVICYAKILFIDHFMNDEPNMSSSNRFRITHSDHFLSKSQVTIVAYVVMYYIIQLANLRYGESDGSMMGSSGGRLTKQLNFEFGEMNVIGRIDKPLYNALNQNFSDTFYFNS